ncbi:MAG TPA: hypothetical protein DEG17_07145 [Cyanobacteria bacterium UBA11149]|nr:hypothetical protein [Cyanobacteria bacterium UBA11367]HBE58338.1 hypothetical protein [Cyanobacteria bacterium UBA11366]HBR72645.1 hypothetical protein [Cyanobacteria bacterium UBA11159]HBS68195.1 hypothetical protein [Cyanobacteria bacterium UBA11153]HBW88642.1 hypothetical protein [Cyanobacteria bacterium UBA11149]HCA93222.1 hypothetical protein [Cyanobacteria bacterium UBA9226]
MHPTDNRIISNISPSCPSDIEILTSLLLRDLPSYGNRIMQRARRLDRSLDQFSYIIIAGRPEFEPLPLNPGQSNFTPSIKDPNPPQQLFFTTLERQYSGGKAIESQNFHWLFLTHTENGWHLVMMFTQLGATSPGFPPTPPRESSNSIIGQGVTIWLRDCREGGIR